jgi:hypothetical protein
MQQVATTRGARANVLWAVEADRLWTEFPLLRQRLPDELMD